MNDSKLKFILFEQNFSFLVDLGEDQNIIFPYGVDNRMSVTLSTELSTLAPSKNDGIEKGRSLYCSGTKQKYINL